MIADSQSKPWYILGAGAIGCLWAYFARSAQRDVKLVLRDQARLALFQQHGGVRVLDQGSEHTMACEATLAIDIQQPVEQLLVCCKAHQTAAAIDVIADKLAGNCRVVLLQNGMGVAEELLTRRPELNVYAAVTTEGAHLVAPFTVRRAGTGVTHIGLYPNDPDGRASAELCRQFGFHGLAVEASKDIYRAQWQKLAVNAVVNPLTALYDINNGALPHHAQAARFIEPLCQEIASVSVAMGIPWSAEEISQKIEAVCQQTSGNISSMLQDLRQQRGTEIRYINGYLLRCAERYGLPNPVNNDLLERIVALEHTFPSE